MTSADVIPGPGEMDNPVILLVEDDVLVRFTTAEMLREEGHTVLEAADASEALALVSMGHPLDIVLSDIRMPGSMDGVALAAVLKETYPHLPVVLVSTHLPPDVEHRADAFMTKPFRLPELLKLIGNLTGPQCPKPSNNLTAS